MPVFFLAVMAVKADEIEFVETVAYNSDYDADTIANNSENNSVSSLESEDSFNPTQDFNVGAQAHAQELLASYKWGVFLFAMTELIDCGKVVVTKLQYNLKIVIIIIEIETYLTKY